VIICNPYGWFMVCAPELLATYSVKFILKRGQFAAPLAFPSVYGAALPLFSFLFPSWIELVSFSDTHSAEGLGKETKTEGHKSQISSYMQLFIWKKRSCYVRWPSLYPAYSLARFMNYVSHFFFLP